MVTILIIGLGKKKATEKTSVHNIFLFSFSFFPFFFFLCTTWPQTGKLLLPLTRIDPSYAQWQARCFATDPTVGWLYSILLVEASKKSSTESERGRYPKGNKFMPIFGSNRSGPQWKDQWNQNSKDETILPNILCYIYVHCRHSLLPCTCIPLTIQFP